MTDVQQKQSSRTQLQHQPRVFSTATRDERKLAAAYVIVGVNFNRLPPAVIGRNVASLGELSPR